MRITDRKAQTYYFNETAEQNWAVRTLERNINTLYYQRLLSSQEKAIVKKEMEEKTFEFQQNVGNFIKNPAVLEFLDLPTNYAYTEAQLEQKLIDNLQQFLLELGKGFAFITRQKHIRTETADFFIDLVFLQLHFKMFCHCRIKSE